MLTDSPPRLLPRRFAAVIAVAALLVAPALLATPVQAAEPAPLVINEVESNGDDTDWVEVFNTGTTALDISGYGFVDGDPSHESYLLPAGSIVPAGGFFVIDQATSTADGFDFGLGGADSVNLVAADGTTPVASYAWSGHAIVTYGRCPDGTGAFADTTVSTKGAPNDCAMPVKINEVESNPASGENDWVELINTSAATIDVSGLVLRDNDDTHAYVFPTGSTIAVGGYLAVESAPTGFDFGLGGADSVRLYAADGMTLIDSYAWTAHATTTYGRCPDGTGEFTTTSHATKGATNVCPGVVTVEAWLGGSTVTPIDDEATFGGDLSGLDWEPSGSSVPGTLWAVQNGDGLLYRIVAEGDSWAPDAANGWADGKVLHYADGTGTVDAEGVTVVGDDSSGGIYVSSERNNDNSKVSRPAVLRYDVSGSATSLTATHEWNFAADFPGLGANAGLEGITWVPDAFLVDGGFVDEKTGVVYDPATYPDHGDGLFFVGVEGTASVYAYALKSDGTFQRIATIATPFALVADVQFDADLAALWVVCDEACEGRTALYELTEGVFTPSRLFARPADMGNIANEGFAVADDAVCAADGTKPTFYADDADTDGFSLRQGTFPCEAPEVPTEPSPTPTATPSPTPSATLPSTGGTGPVPPSELTDATRGPVSGPSSATAGSTVTIALGAQYAGQTVTAWIYSTPVSLGTHVVSAAGSITVTVPASLAAGAHRIAVLDAQGALIGWTDITVTAAKGLAVTGADSSSALIAGGVLLAAGVGAFLLRRRRAASL